MVEAVITDIQHVMPHYAWVLARVLTIEGQPKNVTLRLMGSLPKTTPGDQVRGRMVLRQVHPLHNEGIVTRQNLPVASLKSPLVIERRVPGYFFARWRQWGCQWLQQHVTDNRSRAMMSALIFANLDNMSPQVLEDFKATGTVHVLALSGLHAGVIYTIGWWLIYALCRGCHRARDQGLVYLIARAGAIGLTLAYGAFAGMPSSFARATGMLVIYQVMQSYGWQALDGWVVMLTITLLTQPMSIYSMGTIYSYALVLALLSQSTQNASMGKMKTLWQASVTCFVASMPISALFLHQWSLISLIVNVVMVPWFAMVILPMTLLSFLSLILGVSTPCILYAHLVAMTEYLVHVFAHCDLLWSVSFTHSGHGLCLILFVVLWLIYPQWQRRAASLTLLAPLLVPLSGVAHGQVRVWMLDVGQGLAIVMHTQHHWLLYDAGPVFGASDAGAQVVVPFLRAHGAHRLDTVMISHDDIDHSGGLPAINQALPIRTLISSQPRVQGIMVDQLCDDQLSWREDGVLFEVLSPGVDAVGGKNNHSCVLKVSSKHQSLLLTGDLEKAGELQLIHSHPQGCAATVLQVGHHGSKTSTSEPFLQAVHPEIAWISSGYHNRYHFPHHEVMARLSALAIQVVNTAETGMEVMLMH